MLAPNDSHGALSHGVLTVETGGQKFPQFLTGSRVTGHCPSHHLTDTLGRATECGSGVSEKLTNADQPEQKE